MISTIAFIIFLSITLSNGPKRKKMLTKSFRDWSLDLINLPIQGILVPILQVVIFYELLSQALPSFKGVLELSPILAFLLNFVFVDYIYYWNHRLLHSQMLWPFHKIHHSVEDMDVVATSRNTIWTTFLIAYVWLNSIFIFLLKDPTYYIMAAGVGAALDLWKHSPLRSARILSDQFFIASPIDHQWHHSKKPDVNFGANFNIWDKIHGTYRKELSGPENLGIRTDLPLWRALIFPFKGSNNDPIE